MAAFVATPGARRRAHRGVSVRNELTIDEERALRAKLEEHRLEHRALDGAIERLVADPLMDQVQLRRLKKRKLALKDLIARLESRLIPDQLA